MVSISEAMTAFELSYLISETETFIDVIFNRWVQAIFAVLILVVFIVGTVSTLYFLNHTQKKGASSGAP